MSFSDKLHRYWQILSLKTVFLLIISNKRSDNAVNQALVISLDFVAECWTKSKILNKYTSVSKYGFRILLMNRYKSIDRI